MEMGELGVRGKFAKFDKRVRGLRFRPTVNVEHPRFEVLWQRGVYAAHVTAGQMQQHLRLAAADDVRRRIADVALFAGLPPARLETAMRKATVRQVARSSPASMRTRVVNP